MMTMSHPLLKMGRHTAMSKTEKPGMLIKLSCVQLCIGALEYRSASKPRLKKERQESQMGESRSGRASRVAVTGPGMKCQPTTGTRSDVVEK